jgi:hypothetical protein
VKHDPRHSYHLRLFVHSRGEGIGVGEIDSWYPSDLDAVIFQSQPGTGVSVIKGDNSLDLVRVFVIQHYYIVSRLQVQRLSEYCDSFTYDISLCT